ncbi:hypothetical protein [Micromonospora mirobrigensis]|uniref:Uncharacterized protein n=1 Tax=Micromonospora mirobrigensis TaxID=262898 RepID=A0A1C5AMI5_9ACTN|nr:hypothetical protein [Micromonospora mirobrigensis]SCF46438.1 hypothetical protein GA0070564_11377 [Micromonospora mirobrigensis]
MGIRNSTIVALTGLATVAGLAITPSPAMAYGGGCTDYSRNGWNVGVCSSDNGIRVYGDIYVNTRGSLGGRCSIVMGLFKSGGSLVASRTDGCYSGHHSPISAPMSGGCYYNSFSVNVDGYLRDNGTSPSSCK